MHVVYKFYFERIVAWILDGRQRHPYAEGVKSGEVYLNLMVGKWGVGGERSSRDTLIASHARVYCT